MQRIWTVSQRKGTAEMVEFSAGMQTWQEERYVILLFLLLLGGIFYGEFFMTIALAIQIVKNRGGGGALVQDLALNRANTVIVFSCHIAAKSETKVPDKGHRLTQSRWQLFHTPGFKTGHAVVRDS